MLYKRLYDNVVMKSKDYSKDYDDSKEFSISKVDKSINETINNSRLNN